MNELPRGDISSEQPQITWPTEPGEGRDRRRNYAGAAAVLLAAAILAAVFFMWLWGGGGEMEEAPPIPGPGEARPLGEVSDLTFKAEVLWQTPLQSASLPADIAVLDGRLFVVDTNNNRILEVDQEGNVLQVLDAERDSRLALQGPMAITARDGKLYVANSGAGNVIVISPEGAVEEVITPQVGPAERPVRPIGIAVGADGDIYLSDPDNHRVLHLDAGGGLVSTLGSGTRDSGEYGFNTPGALFLDDWGNLYVVDMLNYTIKKYSPSGEFLLSVGQAGDTEGTFSRPKGVAVDADGRIFVSDTLLVAVEVFDPEGTYLGFIGRENPADKESGSIFQAPHGLKVVGDTLYAVDRFAGLFALRIPD